MSTQKNQEFDFWKIVESKIWREKISFGSIPLSRVDTDTVRACVLMHAMTVRDLLPSHPCRSDSNMIRWCVTNVRKGVQIYGNCPKELVSRLRKVEEPISFNCFKRSWGDSWSSLGMSDFISVFIDMLTAFLYCPSGENFRALNTILCFNARLTLSDVDFSVEALKKYLDVEDHLQRVEGNDNADTIQGMNLIMREWFSDYYPGPLRPRHGPGGVSEAGRTSLWVKYDLLHTTPMINHLIAHTGTDPLEVFPVAPIIRKPHPSRVHFVPKGIDSNRTICMEPVIHQYIQQSILSDLMRYFERHGHLRHVIKLRDANQNCNLAQRAYAENFATIDLSSASDTVSWSLVKDLFAGTRILPGLWCSRSRETVLPDGVVIASRKFAPMGSALCFPVECLVFACVCEYVVRNFRRKRDKFSYSVYGDDIVIRGQYATKVCEILTNLGFIVNTDKSFLSGSFFESCGGEYFTGIDVTPLRLSRRFRHETELQYHPGVIEGLVDLANRASIAGLFTMRRWLILHLLGLPSRLQPYFSGDGKGGLYSPTPTNFHLVSRVNLDLQEDEFRFGYTRIVRVGDEFQWEYQRYFHWWAVSVSSRIEILPNIYLPRIASLLATSKSWESKWDFVS